MSSPTHGAGGPATTAAAWLGVGLARLGAKLGADEKQAAAAGAGVAAAAAAAVAVAVLTSRLIRSGTGSGTGTGSGSGKTDERLPPGSMGWPVVGEMVPLLLNATGFEDERRRRFGDAFVTNILFAPMVRVCTPELNAVVLRAEGMGKAMVSWPETWQKLMGPRALTVVTGPMHVKLRKVLGKSFTPESTRSYLDVVDACVQEYIADFAKADKVDSAKFKALALDIFFRSALGEKMPRERLARITALYGAWTNGFAAIVPWNLPFTAYGKAMRARKEILGEIARMLDEYRANPKADAQSLLGRVLDATDEEGNRLPEQDVVENLLVMLFASHDTTFASMSTAVSVLFDPRNAGVVEKLRKELSESKGLGGARGDGELDFDELRRAPYLNAVVNELWRFVPPINAGIRVALEDIPLPGTPYVVPKDVKMSYAMWSPSRAPEFWGEKAGDFDPDRFLSRADDPRLGGYFLPFGGGNRACIGEHLARLELRAFVARIASPNWTVTVLASRKLTFPFHMMPCEFEVRARR